MGRVVVVGGGAAGMMAAYAAAERGHNAVLVEKNEKLGKKLYITGKGRCNVTNACEQDKFFENIVSNPKFLYSAFYGFDNRQMMNLLEGAGCKLKVERGERVFPVSDHASDVTAALQRLLKQKNVEVRLHARVKELLIIKQENRDDSQDSKNQTKSKDKQYKDKKICGVRLENGEEIEADAVILATGGLSYPTTGSTGDGYLMAETLGHTRKPCVPSLVSLTLAENWCADLEGLSLKNVTLTMTENDKVRYQGFGEMLFTRHGVSGPLVLQASSCYYRCKKAETVMLSLDLKPALSAEQLDKRILRDFEQNLNRQFKNALSGLLPARLIPVVIAQCGIIPEKKVNEITKEERRNLVNSLKGLPMHVTGTGDFEEAVVTRGGISVKEVNPSTMESKVVDGLYFAGEILDVDALTGGFNLQIAWSTGYLAGICAAEKNKK